MKRDRTGEVWSYYGVTYVVVGPSEGTKDWAAHPVNPLEDTFHTVKVIQETSVESLEQVARRLGPYWDPRLIRVA